MATSTQTFEKSIERQTVNYRFTNTVTAPVTIIRIPGKYVKKVSIDMCTQPKLSPEKFYDTYANNDKPTILTNCSFFATATGESIWNLISNGVTYSAYNQIPYSRGFGVTKDGILKNGIYASTGWDDFTTAYPELYKNGIQIRLGDTYNDINYRAQRLCFGWTEDKEEIFFILVEGKGCLLEELQELISVYVPKAFYCANLDGGGSAYVNVTGSRVSESGYVRPVDSVLAVWLKDDATIETEEKEIENGDAVVLKPKVLYRVQLGAFSKKANADSFRDTIRQIEGCEKAFVVYDETKKLYKVQVGAFSIKANAYNFAAKIEDAGYSTYIVEAKVES